ncbi:hypothetical protein [Microbulbifer magnicolonia]|uniref:hypothetical protein n=1 Tax=Microbulbifer magnicolonia TaxID=3109744 RepID=UPI002B40079F|nr:hypothetical protein [Microbulbifer sp. GG15]
MAYKPTDNENIDNLLMLAALLFVTAMLFAFFCGFFWVFANLDDINAVAAAMVQKHPVAVPAAALTCICMTPGLLFMLLAIYLRRERAQYEVLTGPGSLS